MNSPLESILVRIGACGRMLSKSMSSGTRDIKPTKGKRTKFENASVTLTPNFEIVFLYNII